MPVHGRVSVVAHDPEMHVAPASVALCVATERAGRVVHGTQGLEDERRGVAGGVCRLVAARKRGEDEPRAVTPNAVHKALPNASIESDPPADVAAHVEPARPRREPKACVEPVPRGQPAGYPAQRA